MRIFVYAAAFGCLYLGCESLVLMSMWIFFNKENDIKFIFSGIILGVIAIITGSYVLIVI